MKQRITILLTALLLLSSLAWAQTRDEVVAYTLDGTITGGTNGYATESEITQDNITWMVTGNTTMNPWRIGGKNLEAVDRPLYSTGAINGNITRVVVTNGTATITVNSMTLIVSENADFSNPTSTIAGEWEASSTTTFERPADADWTDMYFKLVYNVTETTGNNKYAQFVKAEFYKEMDASAPSIVAENVEITYDATTGAIEYTVNNPAEGMLTANTNSDWLTLGFVGTTIPFTCTVNPTAVARTATVTLIYTYNIDQTVIKNVTVTQTGNPNAVDNISDITATGTYTVQGTIVAKNARGFIVGDGTGYVYYYNTNYTQADYNIGDMVKLSGSVVVYGGVYEFNNSATITAATNSNYVTEAPTVLTGADMDARVASTTPPQLSNYVQYEGTLSISNGHYNITNIAGATTAIGSISYPINVDEITDLDGKQVKVTGYYVGISTSTYYNTMLGSIEESNESAILLDNYEIEVPAEGGEGYINITYQNMVVDDEFLYVEFFDESGENYVTYDWITVEIDANDNVHYVVDANEGAARTAYFKVGYDESVEPGLWKFQNDRDGSWGAEDLGTYSNLVTVYQEAYVPTPSSGEFVRINSLDQVTDGSIVVIAARYDSIATNYFAMKNIIGQKIEGTEFVSQSNGNNEILPNTIANGINEYYWLVGVDNGVYTFTNANGERIGYGSGTNFLTNGDKTEWSIAVDTSSTALVPDYMGYVITNITTTNRGIALRDNDGNKGFGAYSITNLNGNEYNFFLDFFVQTEAIETVTQTTTLNAGWNWWCTYIEQNDIDGLVILEESLGDNGVTIRSQTSGFTDYYSGYGWYGSLSSINNESSYRVITSAPCTITMTGNAAMPSQHPITLSQGWTWIGYVPSTSMSVDAAMASVDAVQGDKLKSQQGYADFYPGYGWFGSLSTIEPGMGLMYYSANSGPVTFTYPDNSRGGALKTNLTSENNHWKPNTYAYPDNMTVMAVVELDDKELTSDSYELAAFAANGECRGSVKLVYAEPLQRYIAFLTISGKDAAELSFGLYDTNTGKEYYDVEESLDFVANAIVGDATSQYVIHFRGTTGMEEFANRVQVYPNPMNRGEQFSLVLSGDETELVSVEIVNTLGMVVEKVCTPSVQTLTAPNVAGVYMVRITMEGEKTCIRKLVVK